MLYIYINIYIHIYIYITVHANCTILLTKGTEHWPWGRGKRGEVKNQGLGVSMAEGGRIGRRG